MRVQLAFLAEAATHTSSGSIAAIGIVIGRINVLTLPLGVPRLDLVLSLIFDKEDLGREHVVIIRPIDPDGKQFLQETRSAFNSSIPERETGIVHSAIMSHNLVIFRSAGLYLFQVYVDESIVASVEYKVHLQTLAEAEEERRLLGEEYSSREEVS